MRAWLASLLLVIACGSVQQQGNLPVPSPPTAALASWKDFPANANPRPLIVLGVTVEHLQPSGFPTSERKIAWLCNRFVFAQGVNPSTAAPAQAAAGNASYPAISATQAYSDLMKSRAAGASAPECAKLNPFFISAVRFGAASFSTDRGVMTMSAWLFDIPEVNAYIGYSAVDPSAFWGGGVSREGRAARVSQDGKTLTIGVTNAEPGPCGFDYTSSTAESNDAVALAVKQIPHAQPGAPVACDLMLRVSYMKVELKSPLGGRVLVDEEGRPGVVCRDDRSSC